MNENTPEKDPTLELPEIPAPVNTSESAPPVDHREPTPVSPEPRRSGWKLFAAAVALIAVGAGVGSATTFGMARTYFSKPPIGYTESLSPGAKVVSQGAAESGSSLVTAVYRRLSPAVVKINVFDSRSRQRGSGSGFVVDPKGYILTNNHVVSGAASIQVKFVDGTILTGKVVGADRFSDLAVVQVDPGNRSLVAAPLGDSESVEVGELAVAIGSPFGQEFSVTAGIVSALNRDIIEEDNPFKIPGAIQTDAAINPGNSGGPLLNGRGEVIGINTAIESTTYGNVGIGFAVPINLAKELLPTLMAGGQVQYPWLGVGLGELDADSAAQIGTDAKEGAIVSRVWRNSPADKAGLENPATNRRNVVTSADVIVAADGKPIKTPEDLIAYLKNKKVGENVVLTVVRGKERLTLTATLANRPQTLEEGE